MSRRRRAIALLGLALVLGGLAFSEVSRREAAVRAQLGPVVDVVVARKTLPAGWTVAPEHLAIRQVPERYAPVDARIPPEALVGERLAGEIAAGGYVGRGQIAVAPDIARPPVQSGERAAEVVGVGPPDLIVPGARVDVLVTREGDSERRGATELALENIEVLEARPVAGPEDGDGAQRVGATLRVKVSDAVLLTSAQSFARELRLLPRAQGDERIAGRIVIGAQEW